MNFIYDESTDLNIAYTVYEGTEVCVDVAQSHYEGTDFSPTKTDFGFHTDKQLESYLEDIVYELLNQNAEDGFDEGVVEDMYFAKNYAE